MTQNDTTVYDFTGHAALNLHLLSAHCNGSALGLTPEEAADQHQHEHFGPGGIRNHDHTALFFDPAKASAIIRECADMSDDFDADVAELLRLPETPAPRAHAPEADLTERLSEIIMGEIVDQPAHMNETGPVRVSGLPRCYAFPMAEKAATGVAAEVAARLATADAREARVRTLHHENQFGQCQACWAKGPHAYDMEFNPVEYPCPTVRALDGLPDPEPSGD